MELGVSPEVGAAARPYRHVEDTYRKEEKMTTTQGEATPEEHATPREAWDAIAEG